MLKGSDVVTGCDYLPPRDELSDDAANTALYGRYHALAEAEPGVVFGGRLAEYRYYDMDDVVSSAVEVAQAVMG